MNTLEIYLGKHVNVIDTDNTEYKNYYVVGFSSAADNDDENEESIDMIPNKNSKSGIGLFQSEIKSIEIA